MHCVRKKAGPYAVSYSFSSLTGKNMHQTAHLNHNLKKNEIYDVRPAKTLIGLRERAVR